MSSQKLSSRVNVSVTQEQHALLLELARLDPDTRSASAFLRRMLDEVTPLLRKSVPTIRAAAQELDSSREDLKAPLRDFLTGIDQGLEQLDLLSHLAEAAAAARSARSRAAARTHRAPAPARGPKADR
jgi:hypothetical protein